MVDDSDIDHIDVLLDALAANDIGLFSITDHNRFDAGLYHALDQRLHDGSCALSASLLAGVEFDVRFQDKKPAAHVIVVFNAQSGEDYDKIETAIGRHLLTDVSDSYGLDDFETVLKEVGLDTILIVHQHSGFGGNQRRRSLGAATDDAVALYKFGYIDALEYNSPKVQGILRGELADFELPMRLLIGSDCHEWAAYPKHDSSADATDAFFTTIKALPTFKGLLMALSSPTTRIGLRQEELRPAYCPGITLCGSYIPFSPGINVIIGENGVGKSSILELLCSGQHQKKAWVKRVSSELAFNCATPPASPEYIPQGSLLESYHKDSVFDDSFFAVPDNTEFELAVREFASDIRCRIKQNIARKALKKRAGETFFTIDPQKEGQTYSFSVSAPEDFADLPNPWDEPSIKLANISRSISVEEARTGVYEPEEITKLRQARLLIEEVRSATTARRDSRTAEVAVRGIVLNAMKKFAATAEARSSDEDRERTVYQSAKDTFVSTVVTLAKDALQAPTQPVARQIHMDAGTARRQRRGFNFVRKAAYAGSNDCVAGFLTTFNAGYKSIENLCAIDTPEEVGKAIPRGKSNTWESDFETLVTKYIEEMETTSDTILDGNEMDTGNTMGERALTYYKYVSLNTDQSTVLVIDQPEDNISNQRVSSDLMNYFNSLRRTSQLIIVTHNPLLAVNLDADNVVALRRNPRGKTEVSFGCLESVEEGNVLQQIADIMDGGKEAIVRRVKAYDSVR